jgi:hypothetical protein
MKKILLLLFLKKGRCNINVKTIFIVCSALIINVFVF